MKYRGISITGSLNLTVALSFVFSLPTVEGGHPTRSSTNLAPTFTEEETCTMASSTQVSYPISIHTPYQSPDTGHKASDSMPATAHSRNAAQNPAGHPPRHSILHYAWRPSSCSITFHPDGRTV